MFVRPSLFYIIHTSVLYKGIYTGSACLSVALLHSEDILTKSRGLEGETNLISASTDSYHS